MEKTYTIQLVSLYKLYMRKNISGDFVWAP